MSSRFNFNGLTTCNNFSSEGLPSNDKVSANTSEGNSIEYEDEIEPLYHPSLQNLTNSYEISFQNQIMTQHSVVFKREFSNYMEFLRIYLSKNDLKLLQRFPQGLYDLKTNMTCQELMMMIESPMTEEVKHKFITQLTHYNILLQFLDIVADYCPSQLAIELVHISQQILDQFLSSSIKEDPFVDGQTLLDLSSSKACKLQNIKMLNLSILGEECSQLRNKYVRFIEIYCATTMFVITQHFENPFFRESEFDGLKRTLSPFSIEEEDEEGSRKSRKIRKFSF